MLPALAPTFCRHPDGCLLQSAFPTELWYYLRKQHTHLKCYISQLLCQEGRSQTKSGKWWVREAAGGCCQGSVTRHSAVLAGTGPLLSLTFHTLWPSSHSSSILWPWGDHKGQAKRIRDVHLNPSFGKLWEPGQVVEALWASLSTFHVMLLKLVERLGRWCPWENTFGMGMWTSLQFLRLM